MSRTSILLATEQPKQPTMKVTVEMKKHIRRPNISEKRPYNGWKAVLVIKYEVVNQAALFAALKSDPMAAYVDAVMVPSTPDKKTLAHKAVHTPSLISIKRDIQVGRCLLALCLLYVPVSIHQNPMEGFHSSSRHFPNVTYMDLLRDSRRGVVSSTPSPWATASFTVRVPVMASPAILSILKGEYLPGCCVIFLDSCWFPTSERMFSRRGNYVAKLEGREPRITVHLSIGGGPAAESTKWFDDKFSSVPI